MILYFSGTGNSEYAAERIGKATGDKVLNLFERLRDGDCSGINSEKPWVIVTPTYAWRIPRILQKWLERTELSGNRDIYFVMTCGDSIGNAGKYLKQLCAKKGLNYRGCAKVVMPENYIALFRTPSEKEALEIIRHAEEAIDQAASVIKREGAFPELGVTLGDRVSSGIVNDIFYPVIVHSKKFHVTDACISCGKCERVCPLQNIHLNQGKPVWGNSCTHCMACICRCPKEAIEYGRHSKGLPRYTFPKESFKMEGECDEK